MQNIPDHMLDYYLILMFSWILFCVSHSLFASLWFKKIVKRYGEKYFKYYRLIYSLISFLMILLILIFQFNKKEILVFKPNIYTIIISSIFLCCGLIIMALCIKKYLSTIANLYNKLNDNNTLVVSGLNKFIRHPLYAGTLIAIWALSFIYPYASNFIFCLILSIYILVGIKLEEGKLKIRFGAAYLHYLKEVPMMIPAFFKKK